MMESTKVKSPLVGKYVFFDGGDYYRTGYIVDFVHGVYLVQFDCMGDAKAKWRWPQQLTTPDEMLAIDVDGNKRWGFFDSREEMKRFLDWADTPPQRLEQHGKVVRPNFSKNGADVT